MVAASRTHIVKVNSNRANRYGIGNPTSTDTILQRTKDIRCRSGKTCPVSLPFRYFIIPFCTNSFHRLFGMCTLIDPASRLGLSKLSTLNKSSCPRENDKSLSLIYWGLVLESLFNDTFELGSFSCKIFWPFTKLDKTTRENRLAHSTIRAISGTQMGARIAKWIFIQRAGRRECIFKVPDGLQEYGKPSSFFTPLQSDRKVE